MINLIIKDVKNIIYDRKTLMVLLVMPIILMTILGNALQGVFSDESGVISINIGVVKEYDYESEKLKALKKIPEIDLDNDMDLDEIDPEKMFFDNFLGNNRMEFIEYTVVSREKANQLIEDNEIVGYIVLPKNYIYNMYASMTFALRNKVELELVKNTNKSFSAEILESIVDIFLDTVNSAAAKKNTLVTLSINEGVTAAYTTLLEEALAEDEEIEVLEKDISGSEPIDSFQYYTVAIMAMFLLYAAAQGGKALLEEKRNFTAQRLEVCGVSVKRAAVSNMIRIMIITFIQTIITIVYSSLIMGVRWGDYKTVFVAMLLTGFAIGGIGMFVSVITYISERATVATVFEMIILQLMALVGGSFIPVEILPKSIQGLQILSANGNALNIYINGMYYKPLGESFQYIAALLTIGILFIILSNGLLNYTLRRGEQ